MTNLMKSISVTDFRSIRGSINVPLDAPVVLIHGQNGSGKTSLLSAIELALTGHVLSLGPRNQDDDLHLVHKEASEGRVSISVEGLAAARGSGSISVGHLGISGTPLLASAHARFFSERCYLAQATLGRLLEIYQDKDARRTDSPLTKFVKDLLGLDHLDALIDGLHDAGDVRRLRAGLPEYWEVRDVIPVTEREIVRQETERARVSSELAVVESRLRATLAKLGVDDKTIAVPSDVGKVLESTSEEPELERTARQRRDISAMRDQWKSLQSSVTDSDRRTAEVAVAAANEALDKWRATTGRRLEDLWANLAVFFSDLPSPSSTRPEHARSTAQQLVARELDRCTGLLSRDADAADKVISLEQEILRAQTRIEILEKQIADQATSAGSLAEALASILPLVTTEDCPVCGRDFQEASARPLHVHLSSRIAALTESAGRLEALSRERVEATTGLAKAQDLLGGTIGVQLTPDARDELKTRRARLDELTTTLSALNPATREGESLIELASQTSRRLNDLRMRDQQATSIRESAAEMLQAVGLEVAGAGESIESALDRLHGRIAAAEAALTVRLASRNAAIVDLRDLGNLNAKRNTMDNDIARQRKELAQLREAKDRADARIAQARELGKRAREIRTDIVRRVFNESLNAIWRDLFVRLAACRT